MTSTSDEVEHTLDLDAIEARANAATPGPWAAREPLMNWIDAENCCHRGAMHVADVRGWGHLTGKGIGAHAMSEDAAIAVQLANSKFITHARTDIPALVAECRSLRNSHDSLVKALELAASSLEESAACADNCEVCRAFMGSHARAARAALSQAKGGK